MAKENSLQLIGYVHSLVMDDVNKIARFNIEVISRTGRTDNPPILVFESVFEKAKDLKDGDLILFKGIVGTSNVSTSYICPNCKQKVNETGLTTSGIAIDIVKLHGQHDLKEFREVSNVVFILGSLCRDVDKKILRSGISNSQYQMAVNTQAQYQMAVNRKLNVREQSDRWTDYPFISSLGEQAEQDYKRMEEGSQCFINGRLQTREIVKKHKCPHCESISKIKENIVEVCPYNVEYLNNCKFEV